MPHATARSGIAPVAARALGARYLMGERGVFALPRACFYLTLAFHASLPAAAAPNQQRGRHHCWMILCRGARAVARAARICNISYVHYYPHYARTFTTTTFYCLSLLRARNSAPPRFRALSACRTSCATPFWRKHAGDSVARALRGGSFSLDRFGRSRPLLVHSWTTYYLLLTAAVPGGRWNLALNNNGARAARGMACRALPLWWRSYRAARLRALFALRRHARCLRASF